MKNRKQARFICLLLLCFLLAGIAVPVRADDVLEVRDVLTDMGMLVPIAKTHYLLAQEKGKTDWGVYSTDGRLLIPCMYTDLSYLSFHCFAAELSSAPAKKQTNAVPTLAEMNSRALVTEDGTRLGDFRYGAFKVFSPYWASGWVLEEGTEQDNDYKANGLFYRISQCDIFYLGSHTLPAEGEREEARMVASLTREEFKDAAAHDRYLYVQDRQGAVTAYDRTFEPAPFQVKNLKEGVYAIKNWAVVNRGTGDMVMDGFSAVEEVLTDDGMLLKATRLDYSGNKKVGVFTVSGEEKMPLMQIGVSTVTADYAFLADSNGKKGLYSLKEKRLLLPCIFDAINACDTTVDPYLLHGFLSADADGIRYYIEAKTGRMFQAENVGNNDGTRRGNTFTSNNRRDGVLTIYAPDKTVSQTKDGYVENVKSLRGSGFLLPVLSDSLGHCLYTWHGEALLKHYSNPFTVTDDDRIIVKTVQNTYKLCEVVANGQ